jgi:aspartyl-tRNA(Asn)/glutamyl-tRNA(Gln) amidotransferase subunit A
MRHCATSACEPTQTSRFAVLDGVFLDRPERTPDGGIRLAVKDLFDTAGLRTTYGSVVFAEHVPGRTADAVAMLEAAGYTNVGKTNLHEFAYGVTSQNPHFGTVPNPVAPGRSAGGSSGGSAAALAAGLAEVALGTDSGGSIRIPAACCAVVGFKPTFGLVSLEGVFPLAPTFDHAGPMARTVEECVEAMRVLVPGFELPDAAEPRVATAWGADERLGAAIDFPLPEHVGPAFMGEVADVHRELFAEHRDAYGDNVRTKIERCLAVTDDEDAAARRRREEYRERAEAALEGVDLLITPTLSIEPPPADVDELSVREAMIRFTFPFNCLGWPALSVPVGDRSVQIVGRPGDDGLVLAAGLSLERGTP